MEAQFTVDGKKYSVFRRAVDLTTEKMDGKIQLPRGFQSGVETLLVWDRTICTTVRKYFSPRSFFLRSVAQIFSRLRK